MNLLKATLAAFTLGGAIFIAGRYSAQQTPQTAYGLVCADGSAPQVVAISEVSVSTPTPTELPTPTPEVYPSATPTAQPSVMVWPTPTKVPSLTPAPTVTAQYTNTPDPGCEGYPCWFHVDQTYIVVNKVWLCLGASPCGSVPENQSRLRDVGETVHVLCLFEEARGGNLWASELACGGSYWSALKYAGRVYMQLK